MKRFFFAVMLTAAIVTSCGKDDGGDTGDSPTVTNNIVEIKESNSVANIQKAIQEALDRSYANATEYVRVIGSKSDGRIPLVLTLPDGDEMDWEANYSGSGLELKGEGILFVQSGAQVTLSALRITGNVHTVVTGTKSLLTVNGDVTASSTKSGSLRSNSGSRVQLNGNVTYTGAKHFYLEARGADSKLAVAGNVTGTADVGNYGLLASIGGEITVGGNVSTAGLYAVEITPNGKLTVRGSVSSPQGYCAHMSKSGGGMAEGIIHGKVTTATDARYIYNGYSDTFVPKTSETTTTTISGGVYTRYESIVVNIVSGQMTTLWRLDIKK